MYANSSKYVRPVRRRAFIINFSLIKKTTWRHSDQGKTDFLLMSKEMYLRLQSIGPGFLKKDVYSREKENNLQPEFLTSLPDMELLELGASQLYVLPRIQKKRILDAKRLTSKVSKNNTIGTKLQSILDPRGRNN